MKKILIVVPGCRTGGVLSSLIALLNSAFVERYDIHLFVMNTYGEQLQSELAQFSIGKNLGTSLLNANVVNSSGIWKLILILFKLGKSRDVLKYICLSFMSFLPLFYFSCIYYFGSLIFCCQFVAIRLIITLFLFESNYYVNFSTPLVILLYLFHTNLLFQ